MIRRLVGKVMRLRPVAVVTATMLAVLLSLSGAALSADIPIATVPVGMSPAAVAVNPLSHRVYVANYYGNTLSVLDGVTDSELATITMPVGGSIGAVPIAVVVNALSSPPRAYVANWQSHIVSFVDESTLTKTATVTVPASNGLGNPRALALWATSTPPKLYVANYHRNSVSVLNAETGASIAEIPVGASPRALAIFTSAGRKRLYVANRFSDNVSIVDMVTDMVVATAPTGAAPKAMAVDQSTGHVFVTSPTSDTVTVIDDTDAVAATVAVGDNPLGIDIEEASGRVFVADYVSNDVVVIDSATNSRVATIPVAAQPWAVATDQGDRKVFITNYGASQVTIIDRDLAVTTCPVGANPYALAVDEGSTPHKTYCANWGSNTVTVIDQPAVIGRAILGPQLAMAAATPATSPVTATVNPFPAHATSNPTPVISGTASSTRSPYRTDIAAVFVRIDGAGSPLLRAEITSGAGTPDVEWRFIPAGPLTLGSHQVTVVVFDDASASTVSSGLDQGGRSASPAGEAGYSFTVVPAVGSIAGTVTGGGFMRPGIRVYVYRQVSGVWTYLLNTLTSADGGYAIQLAPDTYRLCFYDPAATYAQEYYSDASSLELATDIVVGAGAATTADAVLVLAGSGGAANSACSVCHPPASSVDRHGFFVQPVNYATACRKCHDDSLAGTHPYHSASGNCGAVCHPGWGDSLFANVPTYLGTYGAFASASSQDMTASLLHVIHAKGRWEQSADRANSKCGSCHAVAACDACHEGSVDMRHSAHASSMTSLTPWVGDIGSGVIGGDQTIDSHMPASALRCGATACHDTSGVAGSAAGLLDDSSHPANAQYGYLENVVTRGPTPAQWRTQTASVYTLGQEIRSNYTSATLTLPFTGEQIVLVADKDPYRGIAEIAIDGVSQGTVDQYADTTRNQVELFRSVALSPGAHTMQVRVTGTKNAASRAAYVTVDQFKVHAGQPGSVAPSCGSCH